MMNRLCIQMIAVFVVAVFAVAGCNDETPSDTEPADPQDNSSPGAGDNESIGYSADDLIIDHNNTDITKLTLDEINAAKTTLHIAYGHTSHGSQLTTGMKGLVRFADDGGKGLMHPRGIFAFNRGGRKGALDLRDYAMTGDLGQGGDIRWAERTRTYLSKNKDVNVVIWSWCGGCSSSSAEDIAKYCATMSRLEKDYPGVVFVYMTGHLDHKSPQIHQTLIRNNKLIRDYCVRNKKALYDFADIESYDPDGKYYKFANDECNYFAGPQGEALGNWATEWQESHQRGIDWYTCHSAHTQPLNANQKAYAAWALWVRIAKELAPKDN